MARTDFCIMPAYPALSEACFLGRLQEYCVGELVETDRRDATKSQRTYITYISYIELESSWTEDC